jgi:hypothetical protein
MTGSDRVGNKWRELAKQGRNGGIGAKQKTNGRIGHRSREKNEGNRQSREEMERTGQSRKKMEGTGQTRKPLESIPGLLKRLQIRTLNKLTHPRLKNNGHLGEPGEGIWVYRTAPSSYRINESTVESASYLILSRSNTNVRICRNWYRETSKLRYWRSCERIC